MKICELDMSNRTAGVSLRQEDFDLKCKVNELGREYF